MADFDGTTSSSSELCSVSLKELVDTSMKLQEELLSTFLGIRVIVDPGLEGNSYYIAVSQSIYDQLQEKSITPNLPVNFAGIGER